MIYLPSANSEYNREPPVETLSLFSAQKLALQQGGATVLKAGSGTRLLGVLRGEATLLFEKTAVLIRPDSTVLIQGFLDVSCQAAPGTVLASVTFHYTGELPPLTSAPFRKLRNTAEVRDLTQKLANAGRYPSEIPGRREGLLLVLLDAVCRCTRAEGGNYEIYERCCEYAESRAGENPSAQEASAALGYNRDHLNRICRECAGKTLKEVIAGEQLKLLRQLLHDRNLTGTQAAGLLRFDSPELLRKFVRYHTGMSYKEFRDAAKFS